MCYTSMPDYWDISDLCHDEKHVQIFCWAWCYDCFWVTESYWPSGMSTPWFRQRSVPMLILPRKQTGSGARLWIECSCLIVPMKKWAIFVLLVAFNSTFNSSIVYSGLQIASLWTGREWIASLWTVNCKLIHYERYVIIYANIDNKPWSMMDTNRLNSLITPRFFALFVPETTFASLQTSIHYQKNLLNFFF